MGDYGQIFANALIAALLVGLLAGAAGLAAVQFVHRHVHVSFSLSRKP